MKVFILFVLYFSIPLQIYADVVEFDDGTAIAHFRADNERRSYTVEYNSLQRIADVYARTTLPVPAD